MFPGLSFAASPALLRLSARLLPGLSMVVGPLRCLPPSGLARPRPACLGASLSRHRTAASGRPGRGPCPFPPRPPPVGARRYPPAFPRPRPSFVGAAARGRLARWVPRVGASAAAGTGCGCPGGGTWLGRSARRRGYGVTGAGVRRAGFCLPIVAGRYPDIACCGFRVIVRAVARLRSLACLRLRLAPVSRSARVGGGSAGAASPPCPRSAPPAGGPRCPLCAALTPARFSPASCGPPPLAPGRRLRKDAGSHAAARVAPYSGRASGAAPLPGALDRAIRRPASRLRRAALPGRYPGCGGSATAPALPPLIVVRVPHRHSCALSDPAGLPRCVGLLTLGPSLSPGYRRRRVGVLAIRRRSPVPAGPWVGPCSAFPGPAGLGGSGPPAGGPLLFLCAWCRNPSAVYNPQTSLSCLGLKAIKMVVRCPVRRSGSGSGAAPAPVPAASGRARRRPGGPLPQLAPPPAAASERIRAPGAAGTLAPATIIKKTGPAFAGPVFSARRQRRFTL